MLTRIKLRRTQKALNSISDVLLEGEALYSFNNKQLVIGDGTTAVNAINNRIYSHSPVGSGLVFAGPSSGQDSYPTFRKLTSEDISGLLTAGSGITVSGTTISNKGVRSVTSSQSDSAAENGTIKVNTNGSTSYVKVKGLGSAAFEDVTDFAGASHVHNYAGSSSPGGAANSAIKLNTARTIRVNLESTNSASFNGTANISPGVNGILKIANGGLGNNVGYIRTGLKSGSTAGTYSTAEGYLTISSGVQSHAEGRETTASGTDSHAEGRLTVASGSYSHTEGFRTTASGAASHAEGTDTIASGEGNSHAEGYLTKALGNRSHTEGDNTIAAGEQSHAEGYFTIANSRSQHVFGELNIADPETATPSARGTYVEIVGAGTTQQRKNIRTLSWTGDEFLAGSLQVDKSLTVGKSLTVAGNPLVTLSLVASFTSVGTHSWTCPVTGTYLVVVIGGGSGGNAAWGYPIEERGVIASGSSGKVAYKYFNGQANSNYSLVVGRGGTGASGTDNPRNTNDRLIQGTAGGASSFTVDLNTIITAQGAATAISAFASDGGQVPDTHALSSSASPRVSYGGTRIYGIHDDSQWSENCEYPYPWWMLVDNSGVPVSMLAAGNIQDKRVISDSGVGGVTVALPNNKFGSCGYYYYLTTQPSGTSYICPNPTDVGAGGGAIQMIVSNSTTSSVRLQAGNGMSGGVFIYKTSTSLN